MSARRAITAALTLLVACAACSSSTSSTSPTTKASTPTSVKTANSVTTTTLIYAGPAIARLVPVTVTLAEVGGPAPGSPRPLPGTIQLRSDAATFTRAVGVDGTVELSVPPGRYTITGHSPRYGNDGYQCQADHLVILRAATSLPATTTRVGVYCQIK